MTGLSVCPKMLLRNVARIIVMPQVTKDLFVVRFVVVSEWMLRSFITIFSMRLFQSGWKYYEYPPVLRFLITAMIIQTYLEISCCVPRG